MLDNFLKIAATLDWVTPTISIIQTIWNRPSVGYNVPANTQWSTYTIEGLLKKFGVKIWGLALMDDMIIFRVRKAQASYTQYLLERENIPYQGGIGEAAKFLGTREKKEPRPQSASKSWLDSGLDSINKFVDGL